MAYIHIYKNNPTAGGTDGQLVSEGDGSNPITVGPLNATNNEESAPVKLAVRCDSGYQTSGNTTIQPVGTTAAKWALAPDNGGSPGTWTSWGGTLTISSTIGATNTIFWLKAKATSDEVPANDTSVDLQVTATIATA